MVKIDKDHVQSKLIDFNISKKSQKKKEQSERKEALRRKGRSFSMDIANEELSFKFLTHIGSPMYSAPEINKLGFYTESIDIWGIGLINAYSKFGD